jgi:hypothetical protein
MNKHFQWELNQNQIELNLFLEQSYQLSTDSDQTLMRLRVIREWLADLETRAEKLADRVRTKEH